MIALNGRSFSRGVIVLISNSFKYAISMTFFYNNYDQWFRYNEYRWSSERLQRRWRNFNLNRYGTNCSLAIETFLFNSYNFNKNLYFKHSDYSKGGIKGLSEIASTGFYIISSSATSGEILYAFCDGDTSFHIFSKLMFQPIASAKMVSLPSSLKMREAAMFQTVCETNTIVMNKI